MICSTYYDLAQNGYGQWWLLILGLSMGVLGAAFFLVGRSIFFDGPSIFGALLKIGGIGFALGWVIIGVSQTITGYKSYRRALEMKLAGDEQWTQGIVTYFLPYDLSKNSAYESFKVNDRAFSYSPNDAEPGFRQTHAQGSPVQNGVYVRIGLIENFITRLEICQSGT